MKFPDSHTQLCTSLAVRPGGFGNRFHNFLYERLGLNFIYKSGGATEDLGAALRGLRALGIRGCGLSMPYKEEAVQYMDDLDSAAQQIGAINTVVNEGGRLKGYNTDFVAMRELLAALPLSRGSRAILLGSGGMAAACAEALHSCGFVTTLVARNAEKGQPLAERYGWTWQAELPAPGSALLVNATPVGMNPDLNGLPFSAEHVQAAQAVCDVIGKPVQTRLLRMAKELGKHTIDGGEILGIQAREQFRLYTGIELKTELLREAAAFALNP